MAWMDETAAGRLAAPRDACGAVPRPWCGAGVRFRSDRGSAVLVDVALWGCPGVRARLFSLLVATLDYNLSDWWK